MTDYTLYNGDCFDVLKDMPDESVDMVITSPPYDNLREYGGVCEPFTFEKFQTMAQELFRVLKWGGVVIWIVNDQTINGSETGTSFRQALYFKEIGFNIHDTMIWKKDSCAFPETVRYYQNFEYMFVFSKGKVKTFNAIEDRKNKFAGMRVHGTFRNPDGTTTSRSETWSSTICKDYGTRFNVWEIPSEKNNRTGHPAVFPISLARDHISSWTGIGDAVLDPFMGSGTTGEACIQTGRKFIGIEINPDYFKIAEARIKKAVSNFQNVIDFSEDYAT